ncbi:MAG: hypothetical protein C0597_12330 [Marinilabiliales bacterium]|nr:MAG: hypothetical protein C0597_12330 [Marinilabiliales bacterium]
MIRFILHYGMHFLLPFLVAFLFFRMHFWSVSIILLLAILIDLDHLFANPIFNPNRCSIGFHPLHSYEAIAVYFAMLIPKKTRIVAIGLIIHIFGDMIDCILL